VKLTVYDNENVFDTLRDEWDGLLDRSAHQNIFSSWEWQCHWWHSYRPGELFVLVCRDGDDRLLGIAPWFIDSIEGERVVRAIGCVDVTDYTDVLVDADCMRPVLGCFAEYLAEHDNRYDRINLCNMPHFSPTLNHLSDLLKEHGFSTEIEQQEVCPVIQLGNDWTEYLESLDKKQRHEIRRKLRHAGPNSGIDWYIVGDEHDLDEQLDIFLDLMGQSTEYKAEFLADEKNRSFFRSVMPAIYRRGWLQLNFLTVNGEPAATYLNLVYDKRVMVYNSGLSIEHSRLSPGIILLAHNIRHAIEQGCELFDFLRGNEDYKYRMGGQDSPVFMLKARR
jgi:CelD/BcsL family acetyltransferase involved in cellulose biosynthesis